MATLPANGPKDVPHQWDRVFTVLSAEPRRRLVDALLDAPAGEAVPLPDAALAPNGATDADRLEHRLHHSHLPLLEETGLVQWERDPFRAYRGPDFEAVGVVLESLYANADEIPDRLVAGCQALERERSGDHSGGRLRG
ncbi:hypothetical protein [Natrinema salaciae]|uniref:Uncharacterized protein n=1 Tax=Natrinema salaciae TaxID=1186196 RepID=A0A1H9C3K8_9EURY|nr:hypothetical protein [Natrinema salaciae]SEP95551.1 hypothetical protein SAMN04489841_0938 [Natrinema salaciae]